MHTQNKTLRWIYFLILKSIRVPALFILIGLTCVVLSRLDDYLTLKQWAHDFLYIEQWGYLLNVLEPIGQTIIAAALITALYRFVILWCQHKEHDFQQKDSYLPLLVLNTLKKGSRVLYAFILLYTVISILGAGQIYFVYFNKVIYVLLLLTICWMLLEIADTIQNVVLHYAHAKMQDQYKAKDLNTKAQIIRNLSTVIIIFLTITAIFMSFESVKNIGLSLLASAGFITAIIGLAAQKTLTSIFSGLQIAFSNRIKIGDHILIDQQQGIIEFIALTYVAIKLNENRRMIVPINSFIEKTFENWSRQGDNLQGDVVLQLTHAADLNLIRNELSSFLSQNPLWNEKTPNVQLSNFKNDLIEIKVTLSADHQDRLNNLSAEVREHLLYFLKANHPEFLPEPMLLQRSRHASKTEKSL